MIVFKQIDDLQHHLLLEKNKGRSIGFVPTMGALHQGHIQLMEQSIAEGQYTVCSIFVNPTQFNDKEDFAKYPVTIETDISLLAEAGIQVLFLPSVAEMYPHGTTPSQYYDLGYLDQVFEAAHRPGHFQGVCQVVHRLLNIVQPDRLYIGQKDYQQCMVIKQLLALTGLHKTTDLIICPTIREADGLAMSSRNRRLLPADREKATTIYNMLSYAKQHAHQKPLSELTAYAKAQLNLAGFKTDYFSFAQSDNLQEVTNYNASKNLVVVTAAFLGGVRLIDNILV